MKQKKRISVLCLLLAAMMLLGGCGTAPATDGANQKPVALTMTTWSDDVKTAVNDMLATYGSNGTAPAETPYAVFDWDNTTAVFDVCEQLMVWQMDYMCFAFTPEELPAVLKTGLGDLNKDLTDFGYGNGSYQDWIDDITAAYTHLYNAYGPFTFEGICAEENEESQKVYDTIHADPMWAEFSVKLRLMYELIGANESTDVSYPWIVYWFYGMTADEVYQMASRSHEHYKGVETESVTLTTSDSVASKVGVTSITYTNGISVTDNNWELWRALSENGIDVWVCSASQVDLIRAAVDVFDLHSFVKGVMGMTICEQNGRFTNEYDFETGYAYLADGDGGWIKSDKATGAQTQGPGKVEAVNNVCVAQYGHGPIAGFGDSTGDYNFCTEFKSLKLAVVYNRANRKVTDGGGVLAEVAMYQKNTLGYDFAKADAAGDTLYVLQGRDENGLRGFRNSNQTLRLGETEEKLFANEQNEQQLQYMADNQMTTEEAINTFAVKTAEGEGNALGFTYGFLDEYHGYHSR